MSSRDRPRDDDLEERLDELEDVLAELRRDLTRDERYRSGPPRPPRLSELLRFTEQYTIPTLIAVLETTIKSLELLRGTLRLADPGRGMDVDADAGATADRLAGVRDEASAGLARSLSELRTALSEADLPNEAASRSLIQDARDLTAEIEARIEESSHEADSARRRAEESIDDRSTSDRRVDRRDSGGDVVHIDVSDPDDITDESEPADAADETDRASGVDDPSPEVDVESELESIKRQLDEPDSAAVGTGARDDETGDHARGSETDDASDTEDDGDDSRRSADGDDR